MLAPLRPELAIARWTFCASFACRPCYCRNPSHCVLERRVYHDLKYQLGRDRVRGAGNTQPWPWLT